MRTILDRLIQWRDAAARMGRLIMAAALASAGLALEVPVPNPVSGGWWGRGDAWAGVAAQALPCGNLIGDSDFESLISPWEETSIPVTVTLDPGQIPPLVESPVPIASCDSSGCPAKLRDPDPGDPGPVAPAGPASGDTWAWFGGGITDTNPITNVVQILSQPVTLPVNARTRVEFNFWISRADPGANANDRLTVRIADTAIFTATAAVTAAYASGYTPVSVEVSSLASGLPTSLVISATTRAGSPGFPPIVNFNVDDVRVCALFPVYLPALTRN
jgi:hypothetical protein